MAGSEILGLIYLVGFIGSITARRPIRSAYLPKWQLISLAVIKTYDQTAKMAGVLWSFASTSTTSMPVKKE